MITASNSATSKHVCFVLPPIEYYSPQSGGAITKTVLNQARELLHRGYRVSVLTPQDHNQSYSIGEVVPLHFSNRSELNLLQRAISSRVRRSIFRYDWPYYEYYKRAVINAFDYLNNQNSVPDVVVFFNDLQSPQLARKLFPKVRIGLRLGNEVTTNVRDTNRLFNAIDVVLTCSNYIRDWTLKTYQLTLEKVVTAYNGVNPQLFSPTEDFPDSDFLRGDGPLKVLFVGRIDPNKGVDIVTDAVETLRREKCKVDLTVAGGTWFYEQGDEIDPYLERLRAQIGRINGSYLGHVPREELPAIFKAHDVVGIPSRSQEPMANVTLEAMASGCAVIASRRGGLPEVCEGAGLLINPDEPAEFCSALRSLYDDKELLRRKKQRARNRALDYSWQKNVDILERVLLKTESQPMNLS